MRHREASRRPAAIVAAWVVLAGLSVCSAVSVATAHAAGLPASESAPTHRQNLQGGRSLVPLDDQTSRSTASTDRALPGEIFGLWSPSHPDPAAWYSDSDPFFVWHAGVAIAGYGYSVDRNQSAPAKSVLDLGVPDLAVVDDFGVGQSPGKPAFADFNGDHVLDVAVPGMLAGTLRGCAIGLGYGDGTFERAAACSTGDVPRWAVTGDFDSDGEVDVAVTSQSGISVLLGEGDGSFQPPVDTALSWAAGSIDAGDIDRDGSLDLLSSIGILYGQGDGTFRTPVAYPSGLTSVSAFLRDLNGDGWLDLISANSTGDRIAVSLKRSSGTFGPAASYAAAPGLLATGDVNGDGEIDLVSAGTTGNGVSVLLGAGDGTFGPRVEWTTAYMPRGLTVADLDGDGKDDVAVIFKSPSEIKTLEILFSDGARTTFDVTDDPWPSDFGCADLDGDGLCDLWLTIPTYSLRTVLNLTPWPEADAEGLGDGIWYFHINAVGRDGSLGPVATWPVRVDTTPPVTRREAAAWVREVELSPADASSGMIGGEAGTWYAVDGGAYTPGIRIAFAAEGTHSISFYSRDAAGNNEQPQRMTVSVDAHPPETTDDAPLGWQRRPVTVTLRAYDARSGMSGGQAGTWYSVDAGAPQQGSVVKVTTSGSHVLRYWSRDWAGNVEPTREKIVKVDMQGPVTAARKRVTAKRGKRVTFPFAVRDVTPEAWMSIEVRQGRRVRKIISLGRWPTSAKLTAPWTCSLPRGIYTWRVLATDLAGNDQSRASSKGLTVL